MVPTQTEPVIVQNVRGEDRLEYPELLNKYGHPLRYVTVTHPFPNRATRRKQGIRLPLQTLLAYTQMQQEMLMEMSGE